MKKERGSIIVTLIIIALFAGAGIFYVKTSHPNAYQKAVSLIKTAVQNRGSLETVSDEVYDSMPQNDTGESGEIPIELKNVSFDYLSAYSAVKTSMPLKNATLTSAFGSRTDPVTGEKSSTHHGIDLAAPADSQILCFKDGTVEYVDNDPVYGNCVQVSHGDISSFYAHMSEVSVSAGDTLFAGDTVGIIGSTGKSTGVHLHFELRQGDKCIDPADYLYEKI